MKTTPLKKNSPCKVNLLLNILGKRADGFHELETVMHPVNVFDELSRRVLIVDQLHHRDFVEKREFRLRIEAEEL